MFFLQTTTGFSGLMLFGTLGMIILSVGIVLIVVFHQRKVAVYNQQLKKMEEEKQEALLNASIRFQEEERNRIAADLHDDAGPLLASVRLYLTESFVNQNKERQLKGITNAKKIIDESILLIRNISHSLTPPTLKNFGLESAVIDLFQKITGSDIITATSRFHEYEVRLSLDKELLVFRTIQELVNNIIKHSNAAYIHLTQNINNNLMIFRIHHDGVGLLNGDFEKLNYSSSGLGLKNITSRIKLLKAKISFDIDSSNTYYKITIQLPLDK